MFNLQGSELIIILLLALVVLGPEKLPEAMRKAGKAYSELKKMSSSFEQEFRSVLDEPMREVRDTANALRDSADFTKLQAGERDEKPKSAEMAPASDDRDADDRDGDGSDVDGSDGGASEADGAVTSPERRPGDVDITEEPMTVPDGGPSVEGRPPAFESHPGPAEGGADPSGGSTPRSSTPRLRAAPSVESPEPPAGDDGDAVSDRETPG